MRTDTGLRASNHATNDAETEACATVLESRPRMLFLELTRSCNLACPMCRPVVLSSRSLAMTPAVLDRVAEDLFPYVDVVDLRGFGESTLDNRLLPLIDDLIAGGVRTKIITNLATRKPAYWQQFGERDILVGISLEAASPDAYESSRVGAHYDRFAANLTALRAAQEQRGATDSIYFNVVVSEENAAELPLLVGLAADHGINLITLNPLFQGGKGGHYPQVGVKTPDGVLPLADQLEAARALGDDRRVEIRLGANLASDWSGLGGYDQCIHPWSYAFIRYDGEIGFCDHLTTHDAAMFGNILTDGFMSVWNGPQYTALRSQHSRHDFSELQGKGIECDWCYRNRYTDCEDMIDPSKTFMTVGQTASVRQLLPLTPVRRGSAASHGPHA